MNKDLLEKLFKLRRFGIKPGLERISTILNKMGNPQSLLKAIHIAGTNGKGSVASLLASIYKQAGYKVGLYTSPHIFSFNERIKINGKPIADNELEPLVEKYLQLASRFNATFFEITTAIAFEYFANSNTDICVIETGLGGRFDATNVIDPEISVLTKIDFDHEMYLGRTIEEITFEKAGIIKPNKKAIIAPNSKIVYQKLEELKGKSATLIFVEVFAKGRILSIKPNSMNLEIETLIDYYHIDSPLIGKHQFENIATALVCVENLLDNFPIPKNAIIEGIKNVVENACIHGRFEFIRTDPPLIVDVGHNPDAISKTAELVSTILRDTKWNIIFASMSDKNYCKMLEHLYPIAKTFLLPNLEFDRAERNFKLAKCFEQFPESKNIRFQLFDSSFEALVFSLEQNEPTLIIGSFYLIAELVPHLVKILNWNFEITSDRLTI
ncbi:MAG: bifunctional folylpolyglutamate synthase/dihydrofolate synthase [Candidatus Kapaibacteriota bacterium]|jgi:dihydrofolate synthase/folylpolyglutamate synthase